MTDGRGIKFSVRFKKTVLPLHLVKYQDGGVLINSKQVFRHLVLILILSLTLTSCGPIKTAGFVIPDVAKDKFNVAMVWIGPHNDKGWSQSHYEGLDYIARNVPNVYVAYVENVPEGPVSEEVFRALARKGFNLILGTSFGIMDPMATVANEFPDIAFIHLSGNIVVPTGIKLTQLDLDQFPEYGEGCKICMKWWAAGITADVA